jgi:O-antigen/teichoic acid export membrane protein
VSELSSERLDADESTTRQIRGSTLLLVGRVLTVGANLASQVIIVRYLSQSDYGAFAYALSLVAVGQTIVTLGLDRTLTRFASIYDEEGRYGRLLGMLLMQLATVALLGLLVFGGIVLFAPLLSGTLTDDPLAIDLLIILILLAPIQSLDEILIGLFAVFHRPRLIFFRRHIVAPGMRLVVVAGLALLGADVRLVAFGYVAVGLVGVVIYLPQLFTLLRRQGVLTRRAISDFSVPYLEIFSFALPLLSTDLVYVLLNTSDTVLLGYFGTTADVAAYRVVVPAAHLNQLVYTAFTLLFTPVASRLFARGDTVGVNDLYWRTAIWMAVFSFPIFAVTFSLAGPLTETLYGSEYASSALILSLLSLGFYFNVALGFNGVTLRVYGKIKYSIVINLLAAVMNVVLNLALIPLYGPLGAAMGTGGTLIIHNILKQWGLRLGTGINPFDARFLGTYASLVVATVALWGFHQLLDTPLLLDIVVLGLISIGVFVYNRSKLDLATTFPELARIPGMHWIMGR